MSTQRAADRPDLGRGTVRALAPAKINTFLDVLGKRADGFHEVRTFLLAIDLCDEIEARATRNAGVQLVVRGPRASADVPSDERNLAWRSADACLTLARERGLVPRDAGVEMVLEKRIPSLAGLGGGSSDAAAAWLAVQSALGLSAGALSETERDRELARLGSDTVFFARAAASGAAWCTGRGDVVAPAPSPRGWSIALVTPAVASPTAQVYAALESPLSRMAHVPSLDPVDWSSSPASVARASLANRLEPAALSAVAGLKAWRALLDEVGAAHFLLSGSGSSFFGLYDDDAAARTMLDEIDRLSRSRGLASRFCDIVHPLGHGARVLAER